MLPLIISGHTMGSNTGQTCRPSAHRAPAITVLTSDNRSPKGQHAIVLRPNHAHLVSDRPLKNPYPCTGQDTCPGHQNVADDHKWPHNGQ